MNLLDKPLNSVPSELWWNIYNKIACFWGCSSTCTIESNYICTGGTTSNFMSGTWIFLPLTAFSLLQ